MFFNRLQLNVNNNLQHNNVFLLCRYILIQLVCSFLYTVNHNKLVTIYKYNNMMVNIIIYLPTYINHI